MRIPLGNFAQPTALPQPTQGVAPGGRDPVAQAVGALADTATRGLNAFAEEQKIAQAKQREQAQQLAKANAATKLLDYDYAVQSATHGFNVGVASGQVPWQQAQADHADLIGKIELPSVDGLSPADQMIFERGLKKVRYDADLSVQTAAMAAQQNDYKSKWGQVLDTLGKLAAMPGADIEKINARAAAFVPVAKASGLNEAQVSKDLQDFQDNNWTQQAAMRITQAENDPVALQQIGHDLAAQDGLYAGKLDADKRNALYAKVTTRMQMLSDRQQHAQDRADAAGAKAVDQMDAQIASGLPATADMLAQWADATKGTASATDFQDRLQTYRQVQMVLGMPPAQQQTFIQQMQAKLRAGGGSVKELHQLNQLQTAIAGNVKQMQTDPLLWNQARLGDAVKPLDLQDLSSPDGLAGIGAAFQQRAATIESMRKQYGPDVPMRLLLPQEADALQKTLGAATPQDASTLFGLVHQAVGDDQVYSAIMQQLAPKAPVMAYAGMLANRDAAMTTATHWFKPDETISSQQVAATMLSGARILAGKGDKTFALPKDADFRSAFADATGDLFAGRPQAAGLAMQAVKAYYVGAAASDGDTSGELDAGRLKQAIKLALGAPVNVNGNGNVLPPWGMDEDGFEQAAQSAWQRLGTQLKLPQAALDGWDDYGLRQRDDHSYYVLSGRDFLTDAKGNPLVISVQPADAGSAP